MADHASIWSGAQPGPRFDGLARPARNHAPHGPNDRQAGTSAQSRHALPGGCSAVGKRRRRHPHQQWAAWFCDGNRLSAGEVLIMFTSDDMVLGVLYLRTGRGGWSLVRIF